MAAMIKMKIMMMIMMIKTFMVIMKIMRMKGPKMMVMMIIFFRYEFASPEVLAGTTETLRKETLCMFNPDEVSSCHPSNGRRERSR